MATSRALAGVAHGGIRRSSSSTPERFEAVCRVTVDGTAARGEVWQRILADQLLLDATRCSARSDSRSTGDLELQRRARRSLPAPTMAASPGKLRRSRRFSASTRRRRRARDRRRGRCSATFGHGMPQGLDKRLVSMTRVPSPSRFAHSLRAHRARAAPHVVRPRRSTPLARARRSSESPGFAGAHP